VSQQPVFEVVLFSLKPDAETEAFLAAAEAMMPDLRAMRGFVRRDLALGENGRWVDMVQWRTMEDAHAAAEAIMRVPSAMPFMGMIDETSITMLHLNRLLHHNG
jgi:hypothetical protein